MPNTILDYLYRDASNYKKHSSVILAGAMTEAQYKEICACLDEGEYFLPLQVKLAPNRFDSVTEDDHPFFELSGYSVGDFAAPADAVPVEEMVARFKKAAEDGWDSDKYGDI